jgi:hypothetical protein
MLDSPLPPVFCRRARRLTTGIMTAISLTLRDKVSLWLLKLHYYIVCVQCTNGLGSIPAVERTNTLLVKNVTLTPWVECSDVYIYI